MPKISVGDGPTDASQPDYYELGRSHHSPNVTATEGSEDVSPGNKSSESETPTETSRPNELDASQSSAPSTAGRSKRTTGTSSTARSAGTSSNASRSRN